MVIFSEDITFACSCFPTVKKNVAPSPTVLFAQMLPPRLLTMRWIGSQAYAGAEVFPKNHSSGFFTLRSFLSFFPFFSNQTQDMKNLFSENQLSEDTGKKAWEPRTETPPGFQKKKWFDLTFCNLPLNLVLPLLLFSSFLICSHVLCHLLNRKGFDVRQGKK